MYNIIQQFIDGISSILLLRFYLIGFSQWLSQCTLQQKAFRRPKACLPEAGASEHSLKSPIPAKQLLACAREHTFLLKHVSNTVLGRNALSRDIEAIYSNDTARTKLFMDFRFYKGTYIII